MPEKDNKLLKIEPEIKLTPIIKLTGKSTVSLISKFTLLLLELFCIDISIIKNNAELKKTDKTIFLRDKFINFFF